ncbi:MAG: CHAP domain-containing protein, partial [Akkermansiaceae bacterium]
WLLGASLVAGGVMVALNSSRWKTKRSVDDAETSPKLGTELDREDGVPVYANGDAPYKSHGKHFSKDGYYYGRKWQCVEFVKRYYYDHFGHVMPDGWGHARSFFDPEVSQGALNLTRGLLQYRNGMAEAPIKGDLLVYVYGDYGHVAIVSKVEKNTVHIVQQNVSGKVRDTLPLAHHAGNYTVGDGKQPTAWLRCSR